MTKSATVGDVIAGRYEVRRILAMGGTGTVYSAHDTDLDRTVAVKTLRRDRTMARHTVRRFRREAQIIRKLSHPNTVRLYDSGKTRNGALFLVMEYIAGDTLEELISSDVDFPIEVVARIGCQVLGSLAEAHKNGILHRDVKPANVILTEQLGQPYFVKLIDFGMAYRANPEDEPITRVGYAVGTPQYMAPEQVRGEPLTAATDIYSLGATLLELSMGDPLFPGDMSPQEVMSIQASADPIEIPRAIMETPIGPILERALAREPKDRYQSAGAMLCDLQMCQGSVLSGSFDSVAVSLEPRLGGRVVGLLVAALIVGVVIGFLLLSLGR
jgi:serine/threonine protein kinase